jgi:hypothetical protein
MVGTMTAPDNLTPGQHTRQALHRSVDRIKRAWPLAAEDAGARGYTATNYDPKTGIGENTSVETAALKQCRAVRWMLDVEKLAYGWTSREAWIRQVVNLGNQAELYWPATPKKGTTTAGVTVGGRTNTAELCVYCHQPVQPGNTRRIGLDSDPICKTPCWYAVTVSRGQHPRQKEAG